MNPEQQAALDATAAERAAFLEEEQHVIAGVPIKQLLDKPEPYHAGALTPTYHVPGNVERNPLFPLTTESIQEAATEGVELIPAAPSAADLELGEGTLPKGVESIKSTGIFAEPSAATSFVAGTGDAPPEGSKLPSAADLHAIAAEESAKEATQGETVDPSLSEAETSASSIDSQPSPDPAQSADILTTEEQEQPSGNA